MTTPLWHCADQEKPPIDTAVYIAYAFKGNQYGLLGFYGKDCFGRDVAFQALGGGGFDPGATVTHWCLLNDVLDELSETAAFSAAFLLPYYSACDMHVLATLRYKTFLVKRHRENSWHLASWASADREEDLLRFDKDDLPMYRPCFMLRRHDWPKLRPEEVELWIDLDEIMPALPEREVVIGREINYGTDIAALTRLIEDGKF